MRCEIESVEERFGLSAVVTAAVPAAVESVDGFLQALESNEVEVGAAAGRSVLGRHQ